MTPFFRVDIGGKLLPRDILASSSLQMTLNEREYFYKHLYTEVIIIASVNLLRGTLYYYAPNNHITARHSQTASKCTYVSQPFISYLDIFAQGCPLWNGSVSCL